MVFGPSARVVGRLVGIPCVHIGRLLPDNIQPGVGIQAVETVRSDKHTSASYVKGSKDHVGPHCKAGTRRECETEEEHYET